MEDTKWYRVTDPLSPLYGCDVKGWLSEAVFGADDALVIVAMRRVDLLVGNRPFQLVAKEGEDLGTAVRTDHLQESPIQDETFEPVYDAPHGLCLDESEMTRGDGVTLRVARYERATQIAVEDPEEGLLGSATDSSDARSQWESVIVGMFERGDDPADIAYALEN